MKPSVLNTILSYLTEMHIESIESDYNEVLDVYLKHGRYQLCTANAIYSYADKYANFKDSFHMIDLDKEKIDSVLLLGFGLGSIPYMLEKKFNKKYTYTGVEIDESIIYLASKYVLDELKSDVELIQADAYLYIYQSLMKYDLICIDIFVDDKIPDVFLGLDFLNATAENLAENGFIMFNHLSNTKSDMEAAAAYFENVFKQVFHEGVCLDVRGNRMMISDGRVIK
ncbi:MAG: fused MFS/spermidine synthase [Saprospiraceae bacterium]|nr:fused MFS/spermidine synthase [Saprospiraceae bacterium]